MNELLMISATALAGRIRRGEVSSREVVDLHIEAIERVNPVLNAVVATRYQEARRAAKAADERLANEGPDKLPPLHGVPCTIKEAFALEGMPNTSGLQTRVGQRATSDATAVARLRAAGAIPLGVTNTSELCMWLESDNKVYGRSNNPYRPERIVGGSSGGEGAIIGAGASPFGLGSDVGGSIRMPAFFNGVFGHKPSSGLIPNTGQFPQAEGIKGLRYLTTGPLCRRAGDLWPLIQILAGPDGEDIACEARTLGDPTQVSLKGMRVLSVESNGLRPVTRELAETQRQAASGLAGLGASVEHTSIPEFKRSLDYWSTMLGATAETSFGEQLGTPRFRDVLFELSKKVFGRSAHTLPALILAGVEGPLGGNKKNAERIIAEGEAFRDAINEEIGEGVLLYPSYTSTAPHHYVPQLRVIDWLYTAIFNVLELPVTQVPLGLDRHGLPMGIQVVGRHGNDHVTVSVALALEELFGGWVLPEASSSKLADL